jgi:tRNA-splicing ligase RtcB
MQRHPSHAILSSEVIGVEHIPKFNFRAWIPEEKIEPTAREQIHNLAKVPGVHCWIAVMPDVHPGFGMPIGGVAALLDYIIPNAVGVDIGCGVLAIKTNLHFDDVKPHVRPVLQEFLKNIPVGFNKRKSPVDSDLWNHAPQIDLLQRETKNARLQLGTLGGGNHFIEIQRDPNNQIWLMLHSGSRNLGKQVADHFNNEAQNHCKAAGDEFPPGLAWLPVSSQGGNEYFEAMKFCVDFAAENRRQMVAACMNILEKFFPGVMCLEEIESVHNYASKEWHFDKEVVVHRKGAVLAKGKVVIPGSMGTASYIGQGLENPLSFKSCSHGAGRVLGRKEAKRVLQKNQVIADLSQKGILLVTPDLGAAVEEACSAYKNIEEVMEFQQELVRSLLRLEPMGVIKG